VVDAVRTPVGKHGGGLAGVRPDDLLAHVLRALQQRNPSLDPADVDEVYAGAANQSGEDNRNVARMAVLLAGWPTSVPGSTVNRLCASGLDAVITAARAIAVGEASIMVAGGVESMSRSPWVLAKPARGFPRGDETLHSTTLGWRLVNPEMPDAWTISLGESTERLARLYEIRREDADDFSLRSHERALKAWADGRHRAQVVEIPGTDLARDETIREGLTLEQLGGLRAVFRDDGQVTAGNASSLNDGAAALLLADEAGLKRLDAEPLARIRSSGASAVDPDIFGIGPVAAVDKALARSDHRHADVRVMELNEAFAAQALACLSQWPELDPDVVNPLGGAIAIGHPLGASGARLAGSLAHQLAAAGSGVGVAALCIGVGQGLALVMQR
jgi:acetyl-CoA acetyltransferase family protein